MRRPGIKEDFPLISDASFVEEVRQMTPSLYRVSFSLLRQVYDAQDAVQQALMNAWAARARVEPERFRPWLMRIVVNECRNVQRKRMRMQPSNQLERQGDPCPPPDAALADALNRLPEKLRLPLLLRYGEGFSEGEVAAALRLPVSTVKGRLHRGRLALKKEWQHGEEDAQ